MGRKGYILMPGLMEYGKALCLQHNLWRRRVEQKVPDLLLVLEHGHVITLGRRGSWSNIRVSREMLREKGVEVFQVERGGDVTYHGPGQIVLYPILDLRDYGYRVARYVDQLEEIVIQTLADFGISSGRNPVNRGVWVGNEKIASVGVAIRRWVSFHGAALNYDTDLSFFDLIRPCGLEGVCVTSLSKLLGRRITGDSVLKRIVFHFKRIFEREWEEIDLQDLLSYEVTADTDHDNTFIEVR